MAGRVGRGVGGDGARDRAPALQGPRVPLRREGLGTRGCRVTPVTERSSQTGTPKGIRKTQRESPTSAGHPSNEPLSVPSDERVIWCNRRSPDN